MIPGDADLPVLTVIICSRGLARWFQKDSAVPRTNSRFDHLAKFHQSMVTITTTDIWSTM